VTLTNHSSSPHTSPFSHQDGNGYIDEQELDALLKDLCDKKKMVMEPDLSVFLNIIILLLKEQNVCLFHEGQGVL
jgi:hypothetical protein